MTLDATTNNTLQIITASFSFLGSLTILFMLKRVKLTSPYRRLIFGLSTADVFQSFALITGPFASPAGTTYAPWSMGNVQTCDANGFIMVCGSTGVSLYLLLLSVYYHCKVNRRFTDAQFGQLVEKKAHLFILVSTLTICFTALFTQTFNTIYSGGVCFFARVPLGCGTYPEIVGECTRGIFATHYAYTVTIGITAVCFLGITILMIRLICSASYKERIHSLHQHMRGRDQRSCLRNTFHCILFWYWEKDQQETECDADYVLRLHRRETVIQACLYVGSFFLSYAIVFLLMVAAVLHFPIPAWFQTFVSILYPSMGFLNILVYTRPRIQMFRISNPERSWLSSFCLVVRAGGEVPDVEVHPHLKSPCCYCCDFEEVRTDDNESEPNSSFFNIFCMRSYTNTQDQTPTRH